MRSILLRTLYEKRIFMLGWTFGISSLSALMVVFYPSMKAEGAIDALVANMPPALEGLVGDIANLRDFSTYLASQLFDIRSSIIIGIMALILGLNLGTSDEERGDLRTTLALPVSRTSMFIQRWFALAIVTAVVSLGFFIGIYATSPFIKDASIGLDTMLSLVGMTCLVMLLLGSITYAVGAATGKRGVAAFVGIVLLAGSYVITILGTAVSWIEVIEPLSPLYYFSAVEIAKEGIEVTNVTILSSEICIALAVALLFFRSRDIA
jgi:ABC-2 type transport system permease protein